MERGAEGKSESDGRIFNGKCMEKMGKTFRFMRSTSTEEKKSLSLCAAFLHFTSPLDDQSSGKGQQHATEKDQVPVTVKSNRTSRNNDSRERERYASDGNVNEAGLNRFYRYRGAIFFY